MRQNSEPLNSMERMSQALRTSERKDKLKQFHKGTRELFSLNEDIDYQMDLQNKAELYDSDLMQLCQREKEAKQYEQYLEDFEEESVRFDQVLKMKHHKQVEESDDKLKSLKKQPSKKVMEVEETE